MKKRITKLIKKCVCGLVFGLFSFAEVNAADVILFEAENATQVGFSGVKTDVACSGGKYLDSFNGSTGSFNFEISTPEEGWYEMTVYYKTPSNNRNARMRINRQNDFELALRTLTTTFTTKSFSIYLQNGINKFQVAGDVAGSGWTPSFDKFDFVKMGTAPEGISVPVENANLAYPFSYAGDVKSEITVQHPTATLVNLTDNDERTVYNAGVTSTTIIVKCEFPIILSGVLLASQNTNIQSWSITSSTDGTTFSAVTFPNKLELYYGVQLWKTNNTNASVAKAAQYYCLTITGDETIKIGEFQLLGTPVVDGAGGNMPEDITKGDVINAANTRITASASTSTTEAYYNALNRSINSKYTTLVATFPLSLAYEPLAEKKVVSYSLTNQVNFNDRNPRSWMLNAQKTDGEWVTIDTRNDVFFPANLTTLKFDISAPANYKAYSLVISKGRDLEASTSIGIQKFQLFESGLDTGISPIEKENAVVAFGGKEMLTFAADKEMSGQRFSIINLTGQVVCEGVFDGGEKTVNLPSGIYIIKTGHDASKVLVK